MKSFGKKEIIKIPENLEVQTYLTTGQIIINKKQRMMAEIMPYGDIQIRSILKENLIGGNWSKRLML